MEPDNDEPAWMALRQWQAQMDTFVGSRETIRWQLDIRSRRRLDAQSVLMLIFMAVGSPNPGAINISFQGRVLLALP